MLHQKILYNFNRETDLHGHTVICTVLIFMITCAIWYLDLQLHQCHELIFHVSKAKTIGNMSLWQCNISYDECHCSVTSNKFNNSVNCITDNQSMTGYILLPFSFALQIYLIYKLFSFTEYSNRIIRNIFWFATLLIFIISAVTAQWNSCLYFYTIETALFSSAFLTLVTSYLVAHTIYKYHSHTRFEMFRDRELLKTNHKCEIWTIYPGHSFLTNGFRSKNRWNLPEFDKKPMKSDKILPDSIGIQSDPQIGIR